MTQQLEFSSRSLCLFIIMMCVSLPALAGAGQNSNIKVVYHMDDARAGRFALIIAKDQLSTNPNIKIAMVAYGDGVDFLLKGAKDRDGQPYAPDVQELRNMGVQFKVCLATLRFRGIPKDQVLEDLEFVPAGTYEVIRLQAEDGYVYLKP